MTVKELIERLSQFNENAIVEIYDDGYYETPNYIEEHEDNRIIIQVV